MDSTFVNISIPLIAGYLLDIALGDPHWFPHPVKGFGLIIAKGENLLNKRKNRFIKGFIMTVILIALSFSTIYYIHQWIASANIWYSWTFDSLMIYFCLANKCLIDEGKAVFKALDKSLEAGRKRLSWIVGRDTSKLTENQVRIAVFETMSENLSDGVIAPLFFYAIGGVPAIVTYKMVNTLDSMIGYKNERFEQFGKFAARVDDTANFIPARITAILIACLTISKRSFRFILKYGNKHASPNSGYPEAAMAGYLNCQFGGSNYYHGIFVEKPYIGKNIRNINPTEINKVIRINQLVTLTSIIVILLLFFI